MTKKKKCIKCSERDWKRDGHFIDEIGFLHLRHKCRKCGYIYNVVDYLTSVKLDASQITSEPNQPKQS